MRRQPAPTVRSARFPTKPVRDACQAGSFGQPDLEHRILMFLFGNPERLALAIVALRKNAGRTRRPE